MDQTQYQNFSLEVHKKGWQKGRPLVAQLELTHSCPLHCRHCYTDCYNHSDYAEKELTTRQWIQILDKIYRSGVIWLSLTGGDPLTRNDFPEIYAYAKGKGFLVTVLTSGVLINEKMANTFQKMSPFRLDLTLNAVTPETDEAVTGVKGSLGRVQRGIERLRKRNIPFRLKTQVTTQNVQEWRHIRSFVEGLGMSFQPYLFLHARLDGDLTPCRFRLPPEKILKVGREIALDSQGPKEGGCPANPGFSGGRRSFPPQPDPHLIRCAAGVDTFHVDPWGNMMFCFTLRTPAVNLLQGEIGDGLKSFRSLKRKRYKRNSPCRTCSLWRICRSCPGKAYLEAGDEEAPLSYFCEVAKREKEDEEKGD